MKIDSQRVASTYMPQTETENTCSWIHFCQFIYCWPVCMSVNRTMNDKVNRFFLNHFIRSSSPEVFLGKGALKTWSIFTGDHSWRSVVSVKLLRNFFEITFPHECSPANLLHIFRTYFPKNTSGGLLLFHATGDFLYT